MKQYTIAVLPGDGIGEEVMSESLRVLYAIGKTKNITFHCEHGLIGGAAYEKSGTHFPEETKKLGEKSDAILFGSVGGPLTEQHLPKWKGCEANALLALRKAFGFNANFRPAKVYPSLINICPLRADIIAKGVDLLIIRELLGDLYFGEHKRETRAEGRYARDVAEYTEAQIRSVAKRAFEAARLRRKKVTSVDKANVLETGKLWREVVTEVSRDYTDISLEHILVDNCAMQLIRRPSDFDVVLCPNMFGDILSDEAAVLPGSLGLMPSASFNEKGFAYYEPSGGSAPDIAGKGVANPTAQILSIALMLRYSFSLDREAQSIERAIEKTIADGIRTADISEHPKDGVKTKFFVDEVLQRL